MTGKVYLVGSGPGGTGLLTQRAAEIIDAAEVIFYDQLPGEEILSTLPGRAEKIDCGKFGGRHTLEQHEIESLMVDRARKTGLLSGSRAATRSSLAGAGRRSKPSKRRESKQRWCRASPVRSPFPLRWAYRSRTGSMPPR